DGARPSRRRARAATMPASPHVRDEVPDRRRVLRPVRLRRARRAHEARARVSSRLALLLRDRGTRRRVRPLEVATGRRRRGTGVTEDGALILVAGVAVQVVPGPSALLAALVLSGLPSGRFRFEGFQPRKGTARAERLNAIAQSDSTVVVFESPHRVAATLADLRDLCGAARDV